jgi:hypothetical protein
LDCRTQRTKILLLVISNFVEVTTKIYKGGLEYDTLEIITIEYYSLSVVIYCIAEKSYLKKIDCHPRGEL